MSPYSPARRVAATGMPAVAKSLARLSAIAAADTTGLDRRRYHSTAAVMMAENDYHTSNTDPVAIGERLGRRVRDAVAMCCQAEAGGDSSIGDAPRAAADLVWAICNEFGALVAKADRDNIRQIKDAGKVADADIYKMIHSYLGEMRRRKRRRWRAESIRIYSGEDAIKRVDADRVHMVARVLEFGHILCPETCTTSTMSTGTEGMPNPSSLSVVTELKQVITDWIPYYCQLDSRCAKAIAERLMASGSEGRSMWMARMMTKACYRAKRENLATSVYNIAWQWISCQTHVCGRELYEFMSIAKTIIKVYMTSRADVLPQAAADGVFNQVARLTSRYLSQPHGLRDPAEERQVESRLYSVYQIQMCLYACRGQTGKVKRLIYVMRARRRKHGLTIGEQLYLPLFKAYRVRYSKRTGEPFETRLSGQRGWSHRKQVGRECTRYFQQMVGVDGVEPSNEGLRVYLEALAALGQLEQVLKVYDILRSQLREKEDEEGQQQQQQRCAEDRQRVSLVNDGAMVAVHRAFLNWSWHGKSSMADVVFERYPEILEYLQKQKTGGLKGKPRRPGANETAAMSDGALEEYFDTWFCAGRFAADNKTERLDGVSKGDQQLGTTPGTMCGQQRERRSSPARYQEDPPPDLKYRLIRLVSARMVSLSSTLPVDPHPNKEEAPESRLTQVIRWTTLGNRADHFKFLSSFEYYTPVIPNIYILNSYLTARINLLRQEAVTTVTTDVDIGIFRHREILGLWRFVRYLLETVYGSGAMGGNSSGISHGCDAMVWPLVPDTYSISMLIDACTKYGEWQLGQEIWDHISAALSPQQSPRAVAMEGGRRKAESRGGVPTTELPAELARQAQQASIAKIGLFHAYLRFHLRQLGLHNDKHGHPTLRSREELQQSWNFIRKIKEMLRQMDEMGTPITTFFICKLVHHLLELEYCIQQLHQQQQSCDHPQGAGVLTEEIGDLIESLKQWQFNREKVAVSAKGSLVRYLEQRLPPSVINHQHHLNVFLTGVSDVQRDNLLHDDMHAY